MAKKPKTRTSNYNVTATTVLDFLAGGKIF